MHGHIGLLCSTSCLPTTQHPELYSRARSQVLHYPTDLRSATSISHWTHNVTVVSGVTRRPPTTLEILAQRHSRDIHMRNMADPFSLAGSAVQFVALCSNIVGAAESLWYNLDGVERAYTKTLDDLRDLQRALEASLVSTAPKVDREPIRVLVQECEQLSRQISLALGHRPTTLRNRIPDLLRKQLSSCSRAVRAEDVVALKRCVSLVQEGSSVESGQEPVLWRMQRWGVGKLSRLVGTRTVYVPDILKSPSPSVLLVSWLVMALAAAAYHEACPARQYRTAYLFGGAFVALLLGAVEQSDVETVILTNVPWCLAIGMLLDMLVRSIYKVRCRKGAGRQLQVNKWDVKESTRW